MPEQNPQNAKAFDPASFSMPVQPTLNYSVIANDVQPELSSYVQTVFIRPSGAITPGARLTDQDSSDQASIAVGNSPANEPASINEPTPINERAQPSVPPTNTGGSPYQRASVQFNLSDQTLESSAALTQQPSPNPSFAPPADQSNLPYVARTDVPAKQQNDSPPTAFDAIRRTDQQTTPQNPVTQKSQVTIPQTKLVDLRQQTASTEATHSETTRTETPPRDQNTVAKKPDGFLKREAFSNKFRVTRSTDRDLQETGSDNSGGSKIIYLKSAQPVEHTAKLKVPQPMQPTAPQPVAELTVTPAKPTNAFIAPSQRAETQPAQPQPKEPQIIQWPMVESAQDQILFPAPVVTVSSTPVETEFVSTAPPTVAETTRIDFAEVNGEASQEPVPDQATETTFDPFQSTESAPDAFQATETTPDPFATPETPFDPFQTTEAPAAIAPDSPVDSSPDQLSPFQSPPEPASPVSSSPFESSPFESTPEQSSPFESPQEESSPFQASPFESAPEESSPFQSTPDESSPFRSTLFQSPPSPLESANGAELSDGQVSSPPAPPISFADPAEDFSVPAPPVSAVSWAGNNQEEVAERETEQPEKNTVIEAPTQRSDFSNTASDSTLNPKSSPFHVIGHRRTDSAQDLAPVANQVDRFNRLENADSSPTSTAARAKIILPDFKPTASLENAQQHFSAMTLQSGHRVEARSEQQFDTPWLSPWWMLIGLIPILLYVGTMKLFKDEDEYHSHKNELFGSHLKFGSDFGEIGRSKSDATYGRHDEVPVVRGPSGEAVRLDASPHDSGDAARSPIDFAESLEFELPSSTEVAQTVFEPELRIDQSPNFSQSSSAAKPQRKTGRKKKQRSKR